MTHSTAVSRELPAAVELTILMPCLNEAGTLGSCLAKARQFIEHSGLSAEVLVADNGSTDGSAMLATSLGARVIHVAERGYGCALRAGIAAARGRFVVMGDADDSYDFSQLAPFINALRQGADLVVGNRFAGGIAAGAMPPLHRWLGNPVLSFLGRRFFGGPLQDFHCGLRGMRREAMLGLQLVTPGMEFASEMIVKALQAQLVVREVPTTLAKDGRNRRPHLNTWRDGWRHLRYLMLYTPRWLFLYPGAVLALLGLAQLVASNLLMVGHTRCSRRRPWSSVTRPSCSPSAPCWHGASQCSTRRIRASGSSAGWPAGPGCRSAASPRRWRASCCARC